ncbi:GIY-YIG nuclease family protein [Deinococcus apachensis]|uniref:GIY-YIG nuclease family protein n=1 Tax=Deinococcus apachensis TaxID=309886 RepID=UPI0003762866|nr:GIY-YIG nuclease family protein [Deinococcus apachensis]
MTLESDTLRKRALFETWMAEHEQFSTPLTAQGEPIHRKAVLSRIATLMERQGAPEYVYVLTEGRSDKAIPAYVGKARSPVSRWNQHLTGLAKGNGSYLRWRTRLLHEGQDSVQFDLQLHLLIPGLFETRPWVEGPSWPEAREREAHWASQT